MPVFRLVKDSDRDRSNTVRLGIKWGLKWRSRVDCRRDEQSDSRSNMDIARNIPYRLRRRHLCPRFPATRTRLQSPSSRLLPRWIPVAWDFSVYRTRDARSLTLVGNVLSWNVFRIRCRLRARCKSGRSGTKCSRILRRCTARRNCKTPHGQTQKPEVTISRVRGELLVDAISTCRMPVLVADDQRPRLWSPLIVLGGFSRD